MFSALAALSSVALTAYGVHSRHLRVTFHRERYLANPYEESFNERMEAEVSMAVTANIFVTSIIELAWSILSAKGW